MSAVPHPPQVSGIKNLDKIAAQDPSLFYVSHRQDPANRGAQEVNVAESRSSIAAHKCLVRLPIVKEPSLAPGRQRFSISTTQRRPPDFPEGGPFIATCQPVGRECGWPAHRERCCEWACGHGRMSQDSGNQIVLVRLGYLARIEFTLPHVVAIPDVVDIYRAVDLGSVHRGPAFPEQVRFG